MPVIAALITRVRIIKRKRSVANEYEQQLHLDFPRRSRLLSLDSFMSFGMGSDPDGGTLSMVMCANHTGRVSAHKACPGQGVVACTGVCESPSSIAYNLHFMQCYLVKVNSSQVAYGITNSYARGSCSIAPTAVLNNTGRATALSAYIHT